MRSSRRTETESSTRKTGLVRGIIVLCADPVNEKFVTTNESWSDAAKWATYLVAVPEWSNLHDLQSQNAKKAACTDTETLPGGVEWAIEITVPEVSIETCSTVYDRRGGAELDHADEWCHCSFAWCESMENWDRSAFRAAGIISNSRLDRIYKIGTITKRFPSGLQAGELLLWFLFFIRWSPILR